MKITNKDIRNKLNNYMPDSISLRLRLFLFLLLLVFTMLSGVIVILLVSGVFSAGNKEHSKLVKSELNNISSRISDDFGTLSAQAVEFSKKLSNNIEASLENNNITTSSLKDYPELLDELIMSELELTIFSLQRSKCSGAFFILDATINPALEEADYSRAGIYIKNMEPNIVSSTSPTLEILRGSPTIARKNSLDLHAQWSLEFDVSEADYWSAPLNAAKDNKDFKLSYLYYWSTPITLQGTSEEAMFCSVPLIDSKGNVFGVCGFDVSSMLFKLSYTPNNTNYSRIFSMFSPIDNNIIDISKSMIAGGYSVKNITNNDQMLMRVSESKKSLNTYSLDKNNTYSGFHSKVRIYPTESIFDDNTWVCSVLVPKADLEANIMRHNNQLISLLIMLVILGIIISVFFSNRYLTPISRGIEIIKSDEDLLAAKTNIQEIDDLIQYLSIYKQEISQKTEKVQHRLKALEQFVERTKTLTPAERLVFNLYIQGLSAREIADSMFLSINTIKTHTKRIFSKLNINSRDELLLYINLLKEIGEEL